MENMDELLIESEKRTNFFREAGHDIAEKIRLPIKVLSASDTELVIAVNDPKEVPAIVRELVTGGAEIIGVTLQTEDIEDVFLRLYSERN